MPAFRCAHMSPNQQALQNGRLFIPQLVNNLEQQQINLLIDHVVQQLQSGHQIPFRRLQDQAEAPAPPALPKLLRGLAQATAGQ